MARKNCDADTGGLTRAGRRSRRSSPAEAGWRVGARKSLWQSRAAELI